MCSGSANSVVDVSIATSVAKVEMLNIANFITQTSLNLLELVNIVGLRRQADADHRGLYNFWDAFPILLREKEGNASLECPLGCSYIVIIDGVVIDRAKNIDMLLA